MDEREEDDSMDDYDENDNDENMTTSSPVINTQNNNASDEGGVWPISPSAAELFNTLRNINANTNQMSDIVDFMEENLGEELEEDEEYSEEEEEDDDEISEPSPKRPRLSEPESNYTPETQEELKNLPQVHFFNKMKSQGGRLSSSQAENLLRTSSGGVTSLPSLTANLRASQNSILLNNSSPSIIGNSTAADQDKAIIVPPFDQLALCTDFSSLFVYDAAGFKKVAELANCLPSTPGNYQIQQLSSIFRLLITSLKALLFCSTWSGCQYARTCRRFLLDWQCHKVAVLCYYSASFATWSICPSKSFRRHGSQKVRSFCHLSWA
jgi:hypothetical protein